jgi:hypothetical protein
MSGSDGPSGGGMFNAGPQADDCSALRIDDTVASPDPAFTFSVGRILDVVVHAGPPVTVVLEDRGGTVGALHPYPALVRCLTAGVTFQAEVLSAIGGDVRVRVEPVL